MKKQKHLEQCTAAIWHGLNNGDDMQYKAPRQTWTVTVKGKDVQLVLGEVRKLHDATWKILAEHDSDFNKAVRLVCKHRKISEADLFAKCRKERPAMARWCVYWLLRKEHWIRFEIATLCGTKQASVDYGLRALRDRMESDPNLRKELAWLENRAV